MCKRLLAVLLLSIIAPYDAWAVSCAGARTPLQICNRCTVQLLRSTQRDNACEYSMNIPANFAIVGSKVTRQAQHGKVGVSAGEWVYVPAKGFIGSDHFTLERDFVDNAKAFVTFFNVSMEVMP